MKKLAAAALNYCIAALNYCIASLSKLNRRRKEGTLTSYCEVVTYLLESSATDDFFIAEPDAKILRYTQPWNMMPTEYGRALWNKALRCDRDHDEYICKGIFLEGLHGSIRHGCTYWSSKKNATFYELARQATYLTNSKDGSRLSNTAHTTIKLSHHCRNTNDRRSYRKCTAVTYVDA